MRESPWHPTFAATPRSPATAVAPGALSGCEPTGPGILPSVVGEVIAGRYELEELVGSGGMSSVFKARDTLLERHVALKVLHQHYTEDEGRQFIVFEFVEGQTLKDILDEEGRLPVRRALEIAIQVARGLAFAHEN